MLNRKALTKCIKVPAGQLPPSEEDDSTIVTSKPLRASSRDDVMPARPLQITTTFFAASSFSFPSATLSSSL